MKDRTVGDLLPKTLGEEYPEAFKSRKEKERKEKRELLPGEQSALLYGGKPSQSRNDDHDDGDDSDT